MRSVVLFFLSPSRRVARRLLDEKTIKDFRGIIYWNCIFYTILIFTYALCYAPDGRHYLIDFHAIWPLWVVVVSRINELLFAFYEDALSRKGRKKKAEDELPIDSRERIVLLSLAYGEIALQFGIFYYFLQVYHLQNQFDKEFCEPFSALYFSVVTLTTTGYGDFLPISRMARASVIYETLIGIVFIALGISAYMSDERGGSKLREGAGDQTLRD